MGQAYERRTVGGYDFGEVASAMQKAIRRGDARLAGYWAIELHDSGYGQYVWRRLLTVSAEDCAGLITHELEALMRAWETIRKAGSSKRPTQGRIFVAKATLLLSSVAKSRDADHLTNLVHDRRSGISDQTIIAELEEARKTREPIPDYALDVHTRKGRQRGRTKRQFFAEEHDALQPRIAGLFDGDVKDYTGSHDREEW